MRLALILEDDLDLMVSLKKVLELEGLKVISTTKLKEAEKLIYQSKFDLVVLDRLLPDGDGIDLLEELRDLSPSCRTLMLSTKAEVEQRVRGLKKGADDYLGKPFSYQELKLRIKSLLAKQKITSPEVISCGKIILFPQTCSLVISGVRSKLRPRESQILACLIYHKKMVVTDEVLLDFVWGYEGDFPSHRSISVYIRRLRMALGAEAKQLVTVRRVGYCLS